MLPCETITKRIQENLRQIRSYLELNVTEFAECLGVARQTVNNLEMGKTTLSQTQSIAILAIIDRRSRTEHFRRKMIQELLGIDLFDCGNESFLDYWFDSADSSEKNASLLISELIESMPENKNLFTRITINGMVTSSDKVYILGDIIRDNWLPPFIDNFLECITMRSKVLPLVTIKSQLMALQNSDSDDKELRSILSRFSHMKQRGLLFIEDCGNDMSPEEVVNYIIEESRRYNYCFSILTSNKKLRSRETSTVRIYIPDDFSDFPTNF